MKPPIAIFGEAQNGPLNKPLFINSLPDLALHFGEPTETGLGIYIAIQALLANQTLLFYKVSEEGFHPKEYLTGFSLLKKEPLLALALPGVCTKELLDPAKTLSFPLIFNEQDLYDLITF